MNPSTASSQARRSSAPRIWLLIGDKLGDNAQAKILADSLGLPYETRRLLPKQKYVLGKPHFRVSLDHLDLGRSDPLSPPWPDLVITVGRRHAMAALWIKTQNPATRIVLLGRPRRWIEKFDLVVTPPQYQIPDLPNVMRLNLPLMRPDKDAIARQVDHWRPRFEPLQKPIIAVLVGGPTRPYRFDKRVASELVAQCTQLQARYGGTLYFSTSRRTTTDITAALVASLPQPSVFHAWSSAASDNPYLALLGLADYFIVSGDSVSMMMEVADSGKPLAIFPLPSGWRSRTWQAITRRLHAPPGDAVGNRLCHALGRFLYRTGIVGFPRDLTQIHNALIGSGLAVPCGQPFGTQPRPGLPDERLQIRDRILALVKNNGAT